ncbi:MAG TPA: TadE/TadG family type IV pilus assembly protein [Terriglobia bacterium]|nr:TadE/TadG family type IV pilus assembly protein [Terriglobia bacterium]
MPVMKLFARRGKTVRTMTQGRAGLNRWKLERWLQAISETGGAMLLEFALSLPFLLAFVVGVVQFGGAFNLKQKMANAAREGARVMVSNPLTDINCQSQYCSAQAAAHAVANYMTNNGVDSSCIDPSAGTSTGTETWTFTCGNGTSLTINHLYSYTTSVGDLQTGTQVTVTYPYTWFFNRVIKLLVPGSNLALPNRLTETAVMHNIVN